ncbi:hypothetical protein SESBI_49890 [Sesbania bispinosa]|nr:hypothetical protein SESBI_49890 [Sesbania bispinosa]
MNLNLVECKLCWWIYEFSVDMELNNYQICFKSDKASFLLRAPLVKPNQHCPQVRTFLPPSSRDNHLHFTFAFAITLFATSSAPI